MVFRNTISNISIQANFFSFLELSDMVQSYLEALNTKGFVPDWQSTWDVTVKIAYQRASMQFLLENILIVEFLVLCIFW